MILCCGEALIDMIVGHNANGEQVYTPFPGGAVFNTAIALGRLGAPAGFFCGLSDDGFGDLLRDSLTASSVDFRYCPSMPHPTTLAFAHLKNGQATYSFYDEGTAGRVLSVEQIPKPDVASTLFFGGISLVNPPCADAYYALMEQATQTRLCMIDPNIRPDFVQDEPAYRARISTMLQWADIIKISDDDLEWLFGSRDYELKNLLNDRTKLIFLTKGSSGAQAITQNFTVDFVTPKVDVADSVGAGDTFNAGVLASFYNNSVLNREALQELSEEHLHGALAQACCAASFSVTRNGANPPWHDELVEFRAFHSV